MDATVAYRQACLKAIIYLTHFGFTGSQACMLLTAAPVEGRIGGIVGIVDISNCACTVSIPLYDYHCVECDEVFEAIKPVALRDGRLPVRFATAPATTPPEVVDKEIVATLDDPIWGCCRLAEELKRKNILISSPTVQKILIKQRIGSRRERATRVLERAEQSHPLTPQTKPAN